MNNLIDCLRCGQNKQTTLSQQVCDGCRNDTAEFARLNADEVKELEITLDNPEKV